VRAPRASALPAALAVREQESARTCPDRQSWASGPEWDSKRESGVPVLPLPPAKRTAPVCSRRSSEKRRLSSAALNQRRAPPGWCRRPWSARRFRRVAARSRRRSLQPRGRGVVVARVPTMRHSPVRPRSARVQQLLGLSWSPVSPRPSRWMDLWCQAASRARRLRTARRPAATGSRRTRSAKLARQAGSESAPSAPGLFEQGRRHPPCPRVEGAPADSRQPTPTAECHVRSLRWVANRLDPFRQWGRNRPKCPIRSHAHSDRRRGLRSRTPQRASRRPTPSPTAIIANTRAIVAKRRVRRPCLATASAPLASCDW
jgi:hypothetical protein